MTKFQSAPIGLYVDWLRGYIAAGNEPTHYYDYHYSSRFYVAKGDFTTGGECGVFARNVLVPEGVQHLGGDLGHNKLFLFDGFQTPTPYWVPIYCDAEFLALPGAVEFVAEQEKSSRAFWAEQKQREAASFEAMCNSDLGRFALAEREQLRAPERSRRYGTG